MHAGKTKRRKNGPANTRADGRTMNRVRVETPTVRGATLEGSVATTGPVGRFFTGESFRATYPTSIESVPASVRPIPILAHVCPVAWATGADVVVDDVDARFLDGLREIRSTFLELYPEFMRGGSVYCPNPVRSTVDAGAFDGTGMLFTGGVDSTATYVRHREADPTLIGVRGWVIDEDDDREWEATKRHVRTFADERGHEARFVESNMLDFLAMPLLQAHFQRYLEGAWYSSVGHGLGLLGLTAPLAHAERLGTVHIAATHTSDWQKPWGSRPDIDDAVRWSGTRGSHDGYELTRQDKLDLIGAYVDETNTGLRLRTCTYTNRAGNCNDCEKCYRTIVGLLLAGRDPNEFGYACEEGTLRRIRDEFERGDLYVSAQKAYHWEILAEAARERSVDRYAGAAEFLEWLANEDFDSYVEDAERSLRHRALQRLARNTPTSIYATLYPLYRRVANASH